MRRLSYPVLALALPLLALLGCARVGMLPTLPGIAGAIQGAAAVAPAATAVVATEPAATAVPAAAPTTAPSATPAPATVAPAATAPITATASPAPAPRATALPPDPDLFIYVPKSAAAGRPLTVLVTLHGMGGEGRAFCQGLIAEAERNGWLLVAPTFRYHGNWRDPVALVRDDVAVLARLRQALDELPARTGLPVRPRVLLYGFSRGAQIAHRFALAYPERVLGVAAMSAGTYTLPAAEVTRDGVRRPLPLPYGTADLAQQLDRPIDRGAWKSVSFWIGIGAADNRDGDVPAQWTPYIGPNRVARAHAFTTALTEAGIPARLATFPGVDHRETAESRAAASSFFRELVAAAGY